MDDSTTATNNQLLINYGGNTNIPSALLSSDDLLHAPSLPTLPFDIISQILHRLPVKLLLQLRCLCKAWNSLITDLKFAKKQLSMSTTPSITRCLSYSNYSCKYILKSYPLDSIFTNITSNVSQFEIIPAYFGDYIRFDLNCFIIGSCNGILCIANDSKDLFIL